MALDSNKCYCCHHGLHEATEGCPFDADGNVRPDYEESAANMKLDQRRSKSEKAATGSKKKSKRATFTHKKNTISVNFKPQ